MGIKNKLLLGGLLTLVALTANADLPGKHPYYLHALSDLRAARWMLERMSWSSWIPSARAAPRPLSFW